MGMTIQARAAALVLSGAGAVGGVSVAYALAVDRLPAVSPTEVKSLLLGSYVFTGAFLAGVLAIVVGLGLYVHNQARGLTGASSIPIAPGSFIPYLLSTKRYRRYFSVSTVLYGALYAFATSMIVYQPTVNFVQAYHATFPSVGVSLCCGPPLSIPTVTAYLMNHVGLYIVPLDVLLLLMVAPLVGLNVAFAVFARDASAGGASKYGLGGVGAVVGLFTGCPACAGLFLAGSLGGTGAVAFASLLSYYQPEFIAASLPALLLTLYLVSRSLARAYSGGCPIPQRARTLPSAAET
ncbi:MAG: hypothetical protein JRM79_05095 [Nitrososphaerota archaeon]|nr:hypothetical protein [Nitrososphaerota archaeon]MDG6956644.1 hypothetical protein [Nitrososphaerota archaeon]MDG6959002.1 hypothetical protein [Nitrososphaerota archaeon]MDG6987287.1 hypothetical protein [Nitrososphaerota archaeon]